MTIKQEEKMNILKGLFKEEERELESIIMDILDSSLISEGENEEVDDDVTNRVENYVRDMDGWDKQEAWYNDKEKAEEFLTRELSGASILDIIENEGIEGLMEKAGELLIIENCKHDFYNYNNDILSILIRDYIIEKIDVGYQFAIDNDYIKNYIEALASTTNYECGTWRDIRNNLDNLLFRGLGD